MYRHSKSVFLQVTLNFELEYMNISSRHSNFAHLSVTSLITLQGVY